MLAAKRKIDLYGLHYRLLTISEDGQALFETNMFGLWFSNENPDIARYLCSQLEEADSVRIVVEAPFRIFLQNEDMIIQSVES